MAGDKGLLDGMRMLDMRHHVIHLGMGRGTGSGGRVLLGLPGDVLGKWLVTGRIRDGVGERVGERVVDDAGGRVVLSCVHCSDQGR